MTSVYVRLLQSTPAVRRLISIYCSAFFLVLVPGLSPHFRALCMSALACMGLRRAFPVLLSACCMWLGECIAVQFSGTWKYDDVLPGQVAPWLLPLWVLASQWCVDCADATRALSK